MSTQPINRQPQYGRGNPPRTWASTPPPPTPVPEQNGLELIRTMFGEVFGGALTELAVRFWDMYLNDVPFEVIVTEVRKTPEYAQRFPGMKALRDKGRPITEAQYIALERQYAQNRREVGLRPGFYDDPSDFGALIAGEVSADEDRVRLKAWQTYERENRDPVAAEQFREAFAGVGIVLTDGDFIALATDPDRAVTAIERGLAAGQVGTEAVRAGYGPLSATESLRLADLGVGREQARQGFDALASSRELFTALPGEAGDNLGREEQIGAAFATDAAARRRIDTQRRRRLASFEGGTSFSGGRGGLVGLAPAE